MLVSFIQSVREAVSYRGLFTAGWFGVREKHYSRLEIYDHLRASEQADCFIPLKLMWRFENRVVKLSIETGLISHGSSANE